MAKKKPPKASWGFSKAPQTQTLTLSLAKELLKIAYYLEEEEWSKAEAKLESLTKQYPNHPDVWIAWIDFYHDLGDIKGYQEAAERLLKIAPDNADATFELAGAYLVNVRPLLAIEQFRYCINKFPHDSRTTEAQEELKKLEEKIPKFLADLQLEDLTQEEAIKIGILQEEILSKLEQGKLIECHQQAEKLLELRPNFTPALNNLSLAYAAEGEREKAIATAKRVLEIDGNNFHAHGNLTGFYILNGQLEEAKQQAEHLKNIKSENVDIWLKQAESLSYLGDNEGILEAWNQAEKTEYLEIAPPVFFHLTAVAQMNLGREKEARKLWQEALKRSPGFSLAQENLDNLQQPISERHTPWAFEISNWITKTIIDDFLKIVEQGEKLNKELSDPKLNQPYLESHPEIVNLVPLMLKRGCPQTREFALRLALMLKTPKLLEALRDFALSDIGPDKLRQEAAQAATEVGLILSGQVRMWLRGEWHEVLLMGMEISDRPSIKHSKRVRNLQKQAVDALKNDEPAKAESLLKQALEIEPNAPDTLFNLSSAYQLQGRIQEGKDLVRQIHQDYPNYAFARILLARWHIKNKELEAAEELLKPLMQYKHFHFHEFSQFCEAQIELYIAKKLPDAARSWLGMWENVDPDSEKFEYWEERLKRKNSWQLR